MRKVKLISGDSPEQFVENYNTIMAGLEFVDSTELIDTTTMYVFYEEDEPKEEKHLCAECLAHIWGVGCRIHGGVHRHTDEACEDAKLPWNLSKEEVEYWEVMEYETQNKRDM